MAMFLKKLLFATAFISIATTISIAGYLHFAKQQPALAQTANTHYVSPTGAATWGNCGGATPLNGTAACSWQAAMANAIAGDTVYFRGGTYNVEASCSGSWEYIAMKPANSGSPGYYITFMAYPGETPDVTPCTTAPNSPAFGARDVDYIIWDGFTGTMIDGPAETWYFRYWNSNYSIVRNMNFVGESNHNHYHNTSPIVVENSHDIEIYNNNLKCVDGDPAQAVNSACIWFFNVSNSKVHHNTMYDGRSGFMDKLNGNNNNIFYNNFLYNLSSVGIRLYESTITGGGHRVYNNIVVNAKVGLMDYIGAPTGTYLEDNQFYNNTIYGNPTQGGIIFSNMSRNSQAYNNIIQGVGMPFIRYYTGNSKPSYLDYNAYYPVSSGRYWDLNYTTYYSSFTAWQSATGLDTNSTTFDSQFANAGGTNPSDYKLQSGSPALTSGRGGSYASVMGAYITGSEIIGYVAPSSPSPLKGDFNSDSKVNDLDFTSFKNAFKSIFNSIFDLNSDNTIDVKDLGVLMSGWLE